MLTLNLDPIRKIRRGAGTCASGVFVDMWLVGTSPAAWCGDMWCVCRHVVGRDEPSGVVLGTSLEILGTPIEKPLVSKELKGLKNNSPGARDASRA